jgi:ornithine carbamoyltransferase
MTHSILSVTDISSDEMEKIFSRSLKIKKQLKNHESVQVLQNKVVGLLFEKPSTRTRTSFQTAALRLGGQAIYLASNELQLRRGEPIQDTARILGKYLDAIVARVYSHQTVADLARYSGIPVLNGLSDLEHPTQIVCDLLTIKEAKKDLEGLTLAFIGDGNNVANSLLLGTAITGMNMNLACPNGHDPDKATLERAEKIAAETGSKLEIVRKPVDAARDADVLYTDVWVSMGEESEREERLKIFQGYQINSELLSLAEKDAVVMHCLPAHRGLEITDDVIEGNQSIVWAQGENKLYGAIGLLDFFLRGD